MAWKCRLQKSSPEFIHELLARLPAACVQQSLDDYRNHAIVWALNGDASEDDILVSRDALVSSKMKAAQASLEWCGGKHGPVGITADGLIQTGLIAVWLLR